MFIYIYTFYTLIYNRISCTTIIDIISTKTKYYSYFEQILRNEYIGISIYLFNETIIIIHTFSMIKLYWYLFNKNQFYTESPSSPTCVQLF